MKQYDRIPWCKGCIYWRALSNGVTGSGYFVCHYCHDTGKMRGSAPENCEHKTVKKGFKRRINIFIG